MKTYENPVINSKPFTFINASGQYVFEITSGACPGFSQEGIVGQAGGLAICAPSAGDGGFSALITCQNISGTYSAVYGDAVAGGGLSCGGDISTIYPLLTLDPDLSGDCIVDSFTVNGSNQC
jgi:hypothetical protein